MQKRVEWKQNRLPIPPVTRPIGRGYMLFFLFCMLHRRCPPPHHSSCSMVLVVVILDQGVCMHPFPITSPPSQPMSTWYSVFIRSEIAPFVLPDTSAYSDPDSYFAPNASSVPRAFVPWIQPMDPEEELLPSWIPMGPEDECVPMLPMGPPRTGGPAIVAEIVHKKPVVVVFPAASKVHTLGFDVASKSGSEKTGIQNDGSSLAVADLTCLIMESL